MEKNIIVADPFRGYLPHLVHLAAQPLDAAINYYYTASPCRYTGDVLDVRRFASGRVAIAGKKRVKCEGPPSLGAVYQDIGAWRRRVIAHLT